VPFESERVGSVIDAPLGRHSEKPAIFYEMIERWYPDVSKVELFRRGPARPGWAAWGLEALDREEGEAS
jgi:N6-adenosine-specific RNA methylase IME4